MAEPDSTSRRGGRGAALLDLRLEVSPLSLAFGAVGAGERSAAQRLELTGPPLARAVSATVIDPWIRVEERGGGYDVAVIAAGAGSEAGAVTLTGAAGTLHVPVTVQSEGAPTAAPGTTPAPPAQPVTRPAADTPPPQVRPAPPEPARPVRAVSTVIRWAAGLAIGAGAVLAVVIVAGALVADVPVGVLYALHPALLIVGGLCILRPASRTLGLGLVAGAGATAVLPAMLLATAIGAHVVTQRRWALLVLVVVLLGAVAAALASASAHALGARLERSLLRRPAGLVVVAAAVVGSAGLVMGALDYSSSSDGPSQWLIPTCWWSALVALVLPVVAAAASPDRFRGAALAGWVAGAGAFHLVFFAALTAQNITSSGSGLPAAARDAAPPAGRRGTGACGGRPKTGYGLIITCGRVGGGPRPQPSAHPARRASPPGQGLQALLLGCHDLVDHPLDLVRRQRHRERPVVDDHAEHGDDEMSHHAGSRACPAARTG